MHSSFMTAYAPQKLTQTLYQSFHNKSGPMMLGLDYDGRMKNPTIRTPTSRKAVSAPQHGYKGTLMVTKPQEYSSNMVEIRQDQDRYIQRYTLGVSHWRLPFEFPGLKLPTHPRWSFCRGSPLPGLSEAQSMDGEGSQGGQLEYFRGQTNWNCRDIRVPYS